MFGNLGMTEILMLLLICLVLFGAKRIPEIGSSVGKGIRAFKQNISGIGEDATLLTAAPARPREADRDSEVPAPQPRRLL